LIVLLIPEDVLLFITTRNRKMSVLKTKFMSQYFDTVQSQSTKCFAHVACFACCSLGDAS